jgi:hypothetical protein
MYQHDGAANGEMSCEGDSAYFFAGGAISVELTQMPGLRCTTGKDACDG